MNPPLGSAGAKKYQHNGKELQDDYGLDWSRLRRDGARFYDAGLGRFTTIDLLAKKYVFQSPYVYAADNPVRLIDVFGLGPGDRIIVAKRMLGTPYKQETTGVLRTGTDASALQYMDCSEYVSRDMAGDGITKGVKWMNSSKLVSVLSNSKKFVKSTTPGTGDIMAWHNNKTNDGHAGIVESYNKKTKMVTILHATEYKKKDGTKVSSAVEENYPLSYYQAHNAIFANPKVETPDVMGKNYTGGNLKQVDVKAKGSSYVKPIQPQNIKVTNDKNINLK